MIRRIDPVNCGCTDCLIGYSKPIDKCNQSELAMAESIHIQNASGMRIQKNISYSIEEAD